MSGTKRLLQSLSGQEIDPEDKEAFKFFLNRVLLAILLGLLRFVNSVASDSKTVSANTTLDGSEGWVGVNASGGPVTITLASPRSVFHRVVVQKVDATANVVTVAAPAGSSVNGVASLNTAAQWGRFILESDDAAYYA